jgi:hypothetical protein
MLGAARCATLRSVRPERSAVARRVFFSFNFKADAQRVAKIKNIGVVQGQTIVSANQWEKVKGKGDAAIKRWIDTEMAGKSCLIVLIGSRTAGRRWIEYEIKKAWADGLGLVGLRIHKVANLDGNTTRPGRNPRSDFTVGMPRKSLDTVVKTYDPSGVTSAAAYRTISNSLPAWVEEAIKIRKAFKG